jgi:hypothetical protein
MSQEDHDFNWVEARSRCSAAKVFHEIRLGIDGDVKTRNAERPNPPRYVFDTAIKDNTVVVMVTGIGDMAEALQFPQSVTLRLTEAGISVYDKNNKHLWDATLTLNDDGECRLKVNGQELEFWQFRRRALEDLFFRFS